MKKRLVKKTRQKSQPVPKPLGRPKFAVTKATRRRVEQLVSCKMSREDIARAIGCSAPTLDLHFAEELKEGAARKRAEIIDKLYDVACKGNVSALRKLVSMTDGGDLDDPNMKFSSTKYEEGLDIADRPKHNKKFAKRLGKKDQQQKDAEEIDDDVFAAPQSPKLVVNNK